MCDAQLFVFADLKELRWLNVCLLSAKKYWNSDYPPLIVTTKECDGKLPRVAQELKSYVIFVPPMKDRRHTRAIATLKADSYVSSPSHILFLKPDALFTKTCCASDFELDQKPAIVTEGVKELIRRSPHEVQNALQVCSHIIEDLLDAEMENDYSTEPHLIKRETIRNTREAIEGKINRPMRDVVTNIHTEYFMPWNVIGTWLYVMEKVSYAVQDINRHAALIRQFCGELQDPIRGTDAEEVQKILCES